ncbi:MAG: DNA internalization-related competence protein ComEC/Rec2 [Nitrospirae bacterium]|nr:DNA internalization-related competence protein ComEC/Rec2 [Nitrospirota bacterium]
MHSALLPCTVIFIYGIISAELFRCFPITVILLYIFVFLLLHYLFKSNRLFNHYKKHNEPYMFIIAIIWFIIGFSYMLYVSSIEHNDISMYAVGDKYTVTGMLDEPARYASDKVTANLKASKILLGENEVSVSGRLKITVYDPKIILNYGDIIKVTGRLKIIRGFKNPGLFDYSKYIAREGIRTGLSISKKEYILKTGTGGNPVLKKIFILREKIRMAITKNIPEPSAGILKAMVIGDMGTLTNEVRDTFNAAGVTHILSISGSHLGFIALISFFIIRYLLIHLPYNLLIKLSIHIIPSKIAAIFTSVTIIFYTLLSGSETATVRSLIMALVYLLAILTEQDDDPVNTFVMAILIVLLWNPQALFDISFQLSYIAVYSMLITVKRFYKIETEKNIPRWKDYSKKLFLFMLLTISASIATAPITAHYYNQITWTGIISNLIVVPFAGFIILPVGLFTAILTLILNTDVMPLAWLDNVCLNLFYTIIECFAKLPFSIIYTPSPGIVFIIALYLLILSLLFMRNYYSKYLLPISIFLILITAGCNRYKEDYRDSLRITFLDVGQGDSALIEFPDKKRMLIDGGGTFSETFDIGRSVVAPYLWNNGNSEFLGIRKVDYIVSSHPQLDHIEGLLYVIDKFDIGEVWTNGTDNPASKELSKFKKIIQSKGLKEVVIDSDSRERIIGGCRIFFLNPPVEKGSIETNNLSIVMRVLCKDISILFTGDIEASAMEEIAANNSILESTIIKVPHHGSKGSVEDNFISAVNPKIAVISAGYQNSYHHPSPLTISTYENKGASVYRTDLHGAVIIQAEKETLSIRTYEDMVLKEINFNNPKSILITELSNLRKIVTTIPL